MWQHIVKSHRITTKVVVADKCSLAVFKAALVFIPIIVMLIITSLNLISVVVVALDVATDLRWCLRWCKR
jgi:threonine/homoserine efflux transporter RhtA